ncbi:MAG TPA: selenocysteine-specific translation elongation factor, partial [Dissulfurispiraceae bacterium]|nr:selenocysteine-specific translation elongation factor [Dissulfurispiraceae bacterium]
MDSFAVHSTKSIILGTAGHIDHGKSSLVKALTGIDPDRLKEEKERGITIDLGFASIIYSDDLTVGIVDVPGHERLIKNMLAGAGGVDVVLMAIAADEGIMPQTREHLAICELLKIKDGIIALTKADLVDQDWLRLVTDDVRGFVKGTFLERAEILPVSAKTGLHIDTLKSLIRDIALKVQPKRTGGLFRMPVDRVFTLKGFGTVVTGTALSGAITLDSPVKILPEKFSTRVRGLQIHGRSTEKAYAGQRIGINLQGIDRESLKRGDVVVDSDKLLPTRTLDAELEMLKNASVIKSRDRVHFYAGTSETIARIIVYNGEEARPGVSCYCQFRLEDPVVVLSGDRYIIRSFSPLETIGGGKILDPSPVRRKKSTGIEDLVVFKDGSLKDKVDMKVRRSRLRGVSMGEITGWVQGEITEIESAITQLLKEGVLVRSHNLLFHKDGFYAFREKVISEVGRFHKENPLKQGVPKEELRDRVRVGLKEDEKFFDGLVAMINDLTIDKDMIRLTGFSVALSNAEEGTKQKIVATLDKEGFHPPLKNDLARQLSIKEKELNDLLMLLTKDDLLVRISDSIYITKVQYDTMIGLLKKFYAKKSEMSIAEFRDMLGTTRKYALPFVEYLDSRKITLRVG